MTKEQRIKNAEMLADASSDVRQKNSINVECHSVEHSYAAILVIVGMGAPTCKEELAARLLAIFDCVTDCAPGIIFEFMPQD